MAAATLAAVCRTVHSTRDTHAETETHRWWLKRHICVYKFSDWFAFHCHPVFVCSLGILIHFFFESSNEFNQHQNNRSLINICYNLRRCFWSTKSKLLKYTRTSDFEISRRAQTTNFSEKLVCLTGCVYVILPKLNATCYDIFIGFRITRMPAKRKIAVFVVIE